MHLHGNCTCETLRSCFVSLRQMQCYFLSNFICEISIFFLFGAIGCDMIPPETLLEMLISVCYSEGIITDLYFSNVLILCYWPEIVSELDFFKL